MYLLRSLQTPEMPYVGFTRQHLDPRLREHNSGLVPWTNRHRPWTLIAAFWFPDEKTALAFGRYLKSGSGRAFANRHFDPDVDCV